MRRLSRGRSKPSRDATLGFRLSLKAALAFILLPALLLWAGGRQAQQSAEPRLRLVFVGDVVLEASWHPRTHPPADLLRHIRAQLALADLVVCNLEEPLTNFPTHTPHKNPAAVAAGRDFIMRATSPNAAPALRRAGIDVAALANNHTMDYTEQGLLDTLDRLRAAGIVPVGAGENLAAAEQVQVVEKKGLRIGFLSFSDVVPRYYWAEGARPGIASSKEVERVRDAVAEARPQADLLAIIFHWGEQRAREPSGRQQTLARAAAGAGADLILGAHPHVLQGVGCLGRVPVVYSAGNFVFPTRNLNARRSALFEIKLSGARISSVRVLPLLLDGEGRPHLASRTLAQEILRELKQLSTELGASFDGDEARCPAAPQEKPAPKPNPAR
ncbi:MAG: CapA family protein [Terriglobia bacterium]